MAGSVVAVAGVVEAVNVVTESTGANSEANSAKQLAWQAMAIAYESWRVRLAAAVGPGWKSESLAAEVAPTAALAMKCKQEGFEQSADAFE